MKQPPEHIHPVFDQLVSRESKERLLGQRAAVLWLTGLSGSGKSTIAQGLEKALHQKGMLTAVLDGDNIRAGINNNLGFSDNDRRENIRRIAEIAKLFLNNGIILICSFVSPTAEIRSMARDIIGSKDFIEIYVEAPLEECERRDVKGLYAKARRGEVKDFTGITAPFEAPLKPALTINTFRRTAEESVQQVLGYILPLVQPNGVR